MAVAKVTGLLFFYAILINNINAEEPIGGIDLQSSSSSNGGIRCYFGTGNGIQSSVSCPRYTQGCIKRVSCK